MRNDWLLQKLTVQEAEAKHAVQHPQLGPDPVPFGFMNSQWQSMLAKMLEGDELWEFSSPPETWENMMGRAGIALIRDGRIVDWIITVVN